MSEETPQPLPPPALNGDYNPELPVTVSDEEANAAARALGLTSFSAERAKALTKLGAFQSKLGVVHQGVGRLVASMDALEKIRDHLVDIVEVSGDHEVVISAADVANKVINSMTSVISKQAEFQTDGLIDKPRKNNADRKFNPAAAIQVNQGGTVVIQQPQQDSEEPPTSD